MKLLYALRKWQPEMEAAVTRLRESIEKEIQSHFGDDFEEMVIQVATCCGQ